MNSKQTRWSSRYQVALRKHLQQNLTSSLRPATKLGSQAVVLGLETLDVARIHEEALAVRKPSSRDRLLKRAEIFFTETITPIEQTHRATLQANRQVKQLTVTLNRTTSRLAASKQRLKRRITQRKSTEKALKRSKEHYAKLLAESHQLQQHLRHLAHRIISTHEHERTKVSHELQDEIAQTLLGINVRLLMLRTGAAVNAKTLKKEVASAQRLVEKSAKFMARYTHELGNHHET